VERWLSGVVVNTPVICTEKALCSTPGLGHFLSSDPLVILLGYVLQIIIVSLVRICITEYV
jgi:hypothetical protein